MSVSPRVHSAPLSRAYAALRYLEELKADGIRNPVPMTPTDSEAGDDVEAPYGEQLASMLHNFRDGIPREVSPARSDSQTQTNYDFPPQSPSQSRQVDSDRGDSNEALLIEEDRSPTPPPRARREPSSPPQHTSKQDSPIRGNSPVGRVVSSVHSAVGPTSSLMRHTASSKSKAVGASDAGGSRPISRTSSANGGAPRVDSPRAGSTMGGLSVTSVGCSSRTSLHSAPPTAKMGTQGRFSNNIVSPSSEEVEANQNAMTATVAPGSNESVLQRMAMGLSTQTSPHRAAHPSGNSGVTTKSLLSRMLDELVQLKEESQRTAHEVEKLKKTGSEVSFATPSRPNAQSTTETTTTTSVHVNNSYMMDDGGRSPSPPRKVFPKKPFVLALKDAPKPTARKADVDVPPVKTKRLDPNTREPWNDLRPSTLTAQTAASAARKSAIAARPAPQPASDDRYSYANVRTGVTVSGLLFTSPAAPTDSSDVSGTAASGGGGRKRSTSRPVGSITSPRGTHGSDLREQSSHSKRQAEAVRASSASTPPKRISYTARVLSQSKRAPQGAPSPPRKPTLPKQQVGRGGGGSHSSPAKSTEADNNNWGVMPNRHAHATTVPTAQSKVMSPSRGGGATPRRSAPQPLPLASPIPKHSGMDNTSLSAIHQSPPRQPTVSPLSSAGASPPYQSVPPPTVQPLIDYLDNFYGFEDVHDLVSELERCLSYTPRGPADPIEGRAWLAVTLAANHPLILQHVVAPLLVSDLTDTSSFAGSSPRLNQVLCCLVGLGYNARIALQPLLELLGELHPPAGEPSPLYSAVDVKLLVLAIRAVGGEEGLQALSYLASEGVSPAMRAVSLYGMGIFLHPTVGHSSVVVMGSSRLKGKMSFLQPSPKQEPMAGRVASECDDEDVSPDLPEEHTSTFSKPRMPPYRITHVFLEMASVAKYIIAYLARSDNGVSDRSGGVVKRRPAYDTIVRDFLTYAPPVLEKLQPELANSNQPSPLSTLDVADVLKAYPHITRDATDPKAHPPTVPYHSLAEMLAVDDGGVLTHRIVAAVEDVLSILRSDNNGVPLSDDDLLVVEQCMVTCAAQPKVVASSLAAPLIDILVEKGGLNRLEGCSESGARTALGASCVGLANVLHSASYPPSAAVTTVFTKMLRSPEWKVRHAACIALGIAGPSASDAAASAAVSVLLEGLHHSSLGAGTACWALRRLGKAGVAELVELVGKKEVSAAIRCEGVKALGNLDVLQLSKLSHTDVRLVVDGVAKALFALVETTISSDILEDLTSEAVLALGKILSGFVDESPDEDKAWSEAGSYYHNVVAAPLVGLLSSHLEDDSGSDATPSVLVAIATAIALYGGPHGEVKLTHQVLQSSSIPIRIAAAHGLQFRGPRTVRALAATINDPHASVRAEATRTLEAWGTDTICRLLRLRPVEHRRQLISAIDEHVSLFQDGTAHRSTFLQHLREGLIQEGRL